MDLNSGKTYLKMNERILRADNVIYVTDTMDFFVTSNESYKAS